MQKHEKIYDKTNLLMKGQNSMNIFNEKILPNFLEKLTSKDSVRAYRRSCSYLMEYCSKDFLELNPEDIRTYADHLMQLVISGKYSHNYASAEFARVRSVASYIEENFALAGLSYYDNPFKNYIFPSSAGKNVSLSSIPKIETINKLFESVKQDDELYLGLTLILRCSLTSGECIGIKRKDFIVEEDDTMLLAIIKRGYIRHIIVPDDVRVLINQYITTHNSVTDALFINAQNEPMQIRAFQKRYEKAASSCKFGYTMNDIRNSGITYMLACGSSGPETARYLGINERWAYRYTGAAQKLNIVSDDYSNIRIIKN